MQIFDRPSLFNRSDTMLGICQGLGEDLGIHPNLLRLTFAVIMFFNPLAALGAYAGAGVLVLATRLISPVPTPAQQTEADPAAQNGPAEEQEQLPLAA